MGVAGFRSKTAITMLRALEQSRQENEAMRRECAGALLSIRAELDKRDKRIAQVDGGTRDALLLINGFCSKLTLGQRLRWLVTGELPGVR